MKLCSRCGAVLPADRKDSYCKPCRAEYAREHMRKRREQHPELIGEYQRRWRATHPAEVREAKRKAYHKDLEKSRATAKARREANPEAFSEYNATRRRVAAEEGRYALYRHGLSPEQRQELFDQQGGLCALCPRSLVDHPHIHVDHDHKTDLIRGLLCGGCNAKLGWYENRTDRIAAYLAAPHMQPARPRPPSQRKRS